MAEHDDTITADDCDPSNIMLRAGYMRGLAEKVGGGADRMWLLRASRSLRSFALLVEVEAPRKARTTDAPGGQ